MRQQLLLVEINLAIWLSKTLVQVVVEKQHFLF